MAKSDAPSVLIPAPDQQQFASLIRNAADVVLLLSADLTIVDVAQADGQRGSFPRGWIGQRFKDLLGPESVSKVDGLFAQDASVPGTTARWRHLNLSDGIGGSVPLLLKFAGLRGRGSAGGMLLGRDLRPTVELQNQFRISQRELETQLQGQPLATTPTQGSGKITTANRVGGAIVGDMMAKLGQQPMDGIVQETCRILERLCVTEALDRAQGNRDTAARLLGISVEDLHLTLLN